jgi:hypothetical protein
MYLVRKSDSVIAVMIVLAQTQLVGTLFFDQRLREV